MMPTAPYRPCSGGCGARVSRGKCPACALRVEQRRGSASSRGYNSFWTLFRPRFIAMLLKAGIQPICGAALPDGPNRLLKK
jgi:hypothetical protein